MLTRRHVKAVIWSCQAAVSLAIAYFLWSIWAAGQIPPELETRNILDYTQVRIQQFVSKYHRLPGKLSEIPQREDHDDQPIDGWKQPLIFDKLPDGSVILSSLGKPGSGKIRSIRFSIVDENDVADVGAKEFTFHNMRNLETLIQHYTKALHHLPSSLSDLPGPDAPNLGFSVSDAWGRPLAYKVDPDGLVTLQSEGKLGSNQIFCVKFRV